MADYFDNGGSTADAGASANGVAQPAANGDAMDDEILVSPTLQMGQAHKY
jgi:hypothetical protein